MVSGILKPTALAEPSNNYFGSPGVRGENSSRMLLLGQDAQTDQTIVSRPCEVNSQILIEQPMIGKRETTENALNWESGDP